MRRRFERELIKSVKKDEFREHVTIAEPSSSTHSKNRKGIVIVINSDLVFIRIYCFLISEKIDMLTLVITANRSKTSN